MAHNPTSTKVGEMRPGLFRIHSTLNGHSKKKYDFYKQEFQLCGSQSGRKFSITYDHKLLRNKYANHEYTVTIDDISCNVASGDFEDNAVNSRSHQEQPKRQKLVDLNVLESEILRPLYIWIHVGLDSDRTDPFKLIEKNHVQWQADCVGNMQLGFTLWMDFGTNTATENKIAAGLSALFQNQTLCDVQFHLKDGRSVGAHVAILSAGSLVFATMFQSGSKKRQVVIENIEPQIFIQLLTCLYTGSAPELAKMNIAQALTLLQVADLYDVETLKDKCIYVLEKQLSTDNAIEMLIWSHVRVIPKLLESVMKFVLQNSLKLCSQPEWMELMKNHPELCVEVNKRMANLLQQSEN